MTDVFNKNQYNNRPRKPRNWHCTKWNDTTKFNKGAVIDLNHNESWFSPFYPEKVKLHEKLSLRRNKNLKLEKRKNFLRKNKKPR